MIRLAALIWAGTLSGALACPLPPGAIALDPADPAAPPAYAVMDPPPLSAPFTVEIAFCPPDGTSVAGLSFDAVMPAHQHGMNFRVDVAALDATRFAVSNVVFHMPGLWELRLTADIAEARLDYTGAVTLE